MWTIEQLSARVADALSTGYEGQSNGRVRGVPDIRTIRWYTSIGLLDRPAAMRGRTALYHRRHLVQIVAVKRLQADGHTLASVQQQLIGTDDVNLERIARLDERTPELAPTSIPVPVPVPVPASAAKSAPRDRFWSRTGVEGVAQPVQATQATQATRATRPVPPLIQGLRLSADVTLLLEGAVTRPTAAELAAVETAAQPLLALLRELGLAKS